MTSLDLEFDASIRTVQDVPERSVAGSRAAAIDTNRDGGALPYDVVEPPVGLGKIDLAEVKVRGEQLQQKLADTGASGGEHLAVIDDLMAVFLFQAQMAAARGDAKTAEMLSKIAGGMVNKARNALAGAKDGITSKGAESSPAVRQGMADLVQTVQRIAVQARDVAGVAAAAVYRGGDTPGIASGADKTREAVEEAIKQLVAALHAEPDPSRGNGKGKSGVAAGKSPSVVLSTEA